MRKLALALALTLSISVVAGCEGSPTRATDEQVYQVYNSKDRQDIAREIGYEKTRSVKFKLVSATNVIGESVVKKGSIEGGAAGGFLFMTSNIVGSYKEETQLTNYYFGYAENKNGAIYFFRIPADKVRIYQDAEDDMYLVAAGVRLRTENEWDRYEFFNLHVKPGTVIQKADIEIISKGVK